MSVNNVDEERRMAHNEAQRRYRKRLKDELGCPKRIIIDFYKDGDDLYGYLCDKYPYVPSKRGIATHIKRLIKAEKDNPRNVSLDFMGEDEDMYLTLCERLDERGIMPNKDSLADYIKELIKVEIER